MKQKDSLAVFMAGCALVISLLALGVSYKNRIRPQQSNASFGGAIYDWYGGCSNANAKVDATRQAWANLQGSTGIDQSIWDATYTDMMNAQDEFLNGHCDQAF